MEENFSFPSRAFLCGMDGRVRLVDGWRQVPLSVKQQSGMICQKIQILYNSKYYAQLIENT